LCIAIGAGELASSALAQDSVRSEKVTQSQPPAASIAFTPPVPSEGTRSLPINLPTALRLANAQAIDIAAAAERIQVAMAVLQQARALWLPTITVGGDYNHHDGRIQDVSGNISTNSHDAVMVGLGTGIGAAAIFRRTTPSLRRWSPGNGSRLNRQTSRQPSMTRWCQ
jgi:outer membrane protein TolC